MTGKVDLKSWRVLIVDDDQDSIEIVTRILRFHGAHVQGACSGALAMETLKRSAPNLIIMDLSMPQVDGWELLYLLKKDQRFRSIPVVALTAHAMKGDRERALGAGFQSYISKPLNPQSFLDDLNAKFPAADRHYSTGTQEKSQKGAQ